MSAGFRPPPYPYDRLDELREVAEAHPGGCVDLSVGTPTDPAPGFVLAAMAGGAANGYPPSVGSAAYRDAASGWLARRFGVDLDAVGGDLAACIGTKELVAGLPHWLRLRDPGRDTVLYPAVSYPSYAMGAVLAGVRGVPVAMTPELGLDLASIDPADAARALCLWSNSPGNPAGGLDDLGAVAAWGRDHDVPVFSDECYVELTWMGAPRTILEHGPAGVVAVHSLSKRSNLAGLRAGFFAGDADLVGFLKEVRKHAGFMVPGPVQAAGAAAWSDDAHVAEQRARYESRLHMFAAVLARAGLDAVLPGGGFYLWVAAPDGDAWALARRFAEAGGALVSPGELYGDAAATHVRLALVQPQERLDLVAERLAGFDLGARMDA